MQSLLSLGFLGMHRRSDIPDVSHINQFQPMGSSYMVGLLWQSIWIVHVYM